MRWVLGVCLLFGCQDNITTPFPPGLEPLEDNRVEERPDGPFAETLRVETEDSSIVKVYARGFVAVPFDTMWSVAKSPEPNKSTCATSEQIVTVGNEPQYEFSFLIHYVVYDLLTVEWDDQWRFGLVDDGFGMIRHQKVQGSDFVS